LTSTFLRVGIIRGFPAGERLRRRRLLRLRRRLPHLHDVRRLRRRHGHESRTLIALRAVYTHSSSVTDRKRSIVERRSSSARFARLSPRRLDISQNLVWRTHRTQEHQRTQDRSEQTTSEDDGHGSDVRLVHVRALVRGADDALWPVKRHRVRVIHGHARRVHDLRRRRWVVRMHRGRSRMARRAFSSTTETRRRPGARTRVAQ
jgi:hypothetical protein